MKSAVVIVNWNSGPRLRACLESLPKDSAIVVVDNASTDDSIQQAKDSGVPATFIENASNRGLAAALNQGIAATSSEYVLLLNPDVRVTPGAVERLEPVLDRYPRAGVSGDTSTRSTCRHAEAARDTVDDNPRKLWVPRCRSRC